MLWTTIRQARVSARATDPRCRSAVLLDIGMPGHNGFDVCREIRALPWGKQVIVVALTGWSQEEDRRRSEEAGFDAHLVKPLDFQALSSLLQAGALRDRPTHEAQP
jgi:DNA-binding response OmpR family regulator